jgi:RNA recognition motif-containing protein
VNIVAAPQTNKNDKMTTRMKSTSDKIKSAPLDPQANANKILETGRLFLRNLPYTTTEEHLQVEFAKFGAITDLRLIVDKIDKPKGYAIVTYMFPEHALEAYTKMDGQIFHVSCVYCFNYSCCFNYFQGRTLQILAGDEARDDNTLTNIKSVDGANSTFKKEKAAKVKKTGACI